LSVTDDKETQSGDQLVAALLAKVEELTGRVRALEDEREIRELLSRYGYNADAGRDEAYLDLFTEDGAYDISMGESHSAYPTIVRFEGKDALRDFIKDPRAHHRPDYYRQSLHVQGNNVAVHVEGDTAVVNSYSIVLRRSQDSNAYLHAAGTNQWLLKRVDGSWRIKERRRREMAHPDTDENLSATPA
jgi:ketosteroid isomerase-like protein